MAFVSISYGDNRHLLFNPNCQTRLFLENVKQRCQCPDEMEIELSDEYGNLKNITSLPSKYANQVLNVERESLVLIQVKRNTSDVISTSSGADDMSYVPMLNNGEIITAKFKARLGSRDPESARPESKTKRSREKREKTSRRSTEMSSSFERRDDYAASPTLRRNGSSRTKGGQNRTKSRKNK